MSDVTQILSQIEDGDPSAADQLLPLVYEELRKLARRKMAREKPGQTLQTTALVHDAYIRLVGENHGWEGRGHFFSAAAEAMRRILVDNARRKNRLKRGGDMRRVDLSDLEIPIGESSWDLCALDEALTRLAEQHPERAELVKLRYFVGLTHKEAADVMQISGSTADRYWTFARAWLFRELSPPNES